MREHVATEKGEPENERGAMNSGKWKEDELIQQMLRIAVPIALQFFMLACVSATDDSAV